MTQSWVHAGHAASAVAGHRHRISHCECVTARRLCAVVRRNPEAVGTPTAEERVAGAEVDHVDGADQHTRGVTESLAHEQRARQQLASAECGQVAAATGQGGRRPDQKNAIVLTSMLSRCCASGAVSGSSKAL